MGTERERDNEPLNCGPISQKLQELGLLADRRDDGRTNTGLTATLTESEDKARTEITLDVSLDLTQAQDKMGVIWGQIASGYQWLLLL